MNRSAQPMDSVLEAIGQTPLERLTALLSRETPAALVRRAGALVSIVTRYDVLRHVAGIR